MSSNDEEIRYNGADKRRCCSYERNFVNEGEIAQGQLIYAT